MQHSIVPHPWDKYCRVCDCQDSELTRECPGRKLDECEKSYVRTGHLIFIKGEWYVRAKDL